MEDEISLEEREPIDLEIVGEVVAGEEEAENLLSEELYGDHLIENKTYEEDEGFVNEITIAENSGATEEILGTGDTEAQEQDEQEEQQNALKVEPNF